jgi:hypothetical protein
MSWINFLPCGATPSGKTQIWTVRATLQAGAILGMIRWHGAWRKYAFYPNKDTLFEEDCLRDIANFCEGQTKQHREAKNPPCQRA